MADILKVHPETPQARLIGRAVDELRRGEIVIYPTDSCYAFGWTIGNRRAAEVVRRLRGTGKHHNFTLVCRDLSELGTYARVENWAYRSLRSATPGPYTFVLTATRDVPRRLQNPKRRTIGIRVPDHAVVDALVDTLGEPLMSSTLSLPGADFPITDTDDIPGQVASSVAAVLDSGNCGIEPTTVVDLTGTYPILIREGKGSPDPFL
jgi:tRNA threonylcarbamoyl adenosine modification protein (Sua5/YciO/YrdC/YwlC family)